MIYVPFELEQMELGMRIPVIPLPEKFQKECSLSIIPSGQFVNLWTN